MEKCSWNSENSTLEFCVSISRKNSPTIEEKRILARTTKWKSNRTPSFVRWGKCLLFYSFFICSLLKFTMEQRATWVYIWLKNITYLWSMLMRLLLLLQLLTVAVLRSLFSHSSVANCCLREKTIQCSTVCKHVRCGFFHIWGGFNKKMQEKSTQLNFYVYCVRRIKVSRFYNGVICFTLILVQSIGSRLMQLRYLFQWHEKKNTETTNISPQHHHQY